MPDAPQPSDRPTPPAPAAPAADGPALRIDVLGPPRVAWAGRPLALPRRQARALLYRLAASPGPVPRDQLAFLFWPDAPDAAARRGLVVLLNHLRRALPVPAALVSDGDAVGLDGRAVRSDALVADAAIANGVRERRLDRLAAAVALYRGPFLEGFALPGGGEFEAWAARERERWERRCLEALEALVAGHAAHGDHRAAVAAARRALAIDETAEAMHRRLIALHAAAGDRAAAVRQFERCAAVLERELGVPPSAVTRAVYEAARDGRAPPPERPPAGPAAPAWRLTPADPPADERPRPAPTLPVPPTPLLGRAAEVAAVHTLLTGPDSRLVTLSGPGGAGKTRLALELARAVRGHFADGVTFVALAPLRDPALVVSAIAGACGLQESGGAPLEEVVRGHLREREALLVLDNCEHLLDAAPAIAGLLSSAPRLRVLATSRVALNLAGEHIFPVPPLPPPDPARLPALPALAEQPAVALLTARARAADPAFRLTDANAADVAAICARLEGLPLAIELAAARLKLLTPRALLDRLDRPLALLAGGPRDLPARQRTLRATLDWSYRLLGAAEQSLFERLGVFAGDFGLEAAEAVGPGEAADGSPVLDGLQALLDANLLLRAGEADGEPRFRLLETVREYAAERLVERGAAGAAGRAHAVFYRDLAERAAEATGADLARRFARLDAEHADLLLAIDRALAAGDGGTGLRLTAALGRYWFARGHLADGRRRLVRALAAAGAAQAPAGAEARARAHEHACQLAIVQGDYAGGLTHMRAAADGWRALGRRRELALALLTLGGAAGLAGDGATAATAWAEGVALAEVLADPEALATVAWGKGRDARHTAASAAARGWLEAALAHARRRDDPIVLAHILLDLAAVTLALGDAGGARAQAEEALAVARDLGLRTGMAQALNELGEIARYRGDDRAAAARYAESLRHWREMGNRSDVPRLLHNLAYVALHAGDADRAAELFRQSLAQFGEQGIARGVAEGLAGLACVAAARGRSLRAARLWGAAEARRTAGGRAWGESGALDEAGGWAMWPPDRVEYARYLARARAAAVAAEFDAAWRTGRALTAEQALAEAADVAATERAPGTAAPAPGPTTAAAPVDSL